MANSFLSQEEIDSLLNGGSVDSNDDENKADEEYLSEIEKDLLGEIGNISMGSASTALSTILNQPVNITTPQVTTTTLRKLKETFEVPNICLEVEFISGITGENLLVMKVSDAAVIASLMMGGDGNIPEGIENLSEIEESAVSEAMNQMIGSAATSMATMFSREVNISPPKSRIWNDSTTALTDGMKDDEEIIKVAFKLTVGDLVDSEIMQILPLNTGKKIVGIMTGEENSIEDIPKETPIELPEENFKLDKQKDYNQEIPSHKDSINLTEKRNIEEVRSEPKVEVKKAAFQPLEPSQTAAMPSNIDLILDVPLEISVVLGKTKKSIKEILNLSTGSLVELDKLAEEPVEILVNGKMVAQGEVVVVDENFGVRITSIMSNAERVKSLGK
ncbi:flagellar motor switch phosphatase FliY [Haloimpatiens lingqiaonensis]|uniref:flagellar motor switch phosphatase FliY n=1 Tax=Haloimpatiens lingqiaonensis TaxID=1380675 RepID=UPI0010FF48FA|nr:flagellar motor switch phosphatase FliY [Haloimpatiens lingqiaonensis]